MILDKKKKEMSAEQSPNGEMASLTEAKLQFLIVGRWNEHPAFTPDGNWSYDLSAEDVCVSITALCAY